MDDRSIAHEKIRQTVTENKIVLFMKGTARMPMCGFSARVVKTLDELGVSFKDVDVLADPVIREEIKAYSNWPTLPQLYAGGEFIGGCDIVIDLHKRGELGPQLRRVLGS